MGKKKRRRGTTYRRNRHAHRVPPQQKKNRGCLDLEKKIGESAEFRRAEKKGKKDH